MYNYSIKKYFTKQIRYITIGKGLSFKAGMRESEEKLW